MGKISRALTIAGSDSGGGAGIQADLKTFAALGVHGMSAVASVTAQNTVGVYETYDLPPELIAKQIDVVVEDIGVDAAKTGMLHSKEIIEVVAGKIAKHGFPTVVDPVMMAEVGAPLIQEDAVDTLREKLIPVAEVVAPNILEAQALTGIEIETVEDMRKAAVEISKFGAAAVVVKGGHLKQEKAVDVLYYDGDFFTFEADKYRDVGIHGAGCTFSAAIAAQLAKRMGVPEAVKTAKDFITQAIRFCLDVGRGVKPVDPLAIINLQLEKQKVLENVERAMDKFVSHPLSVKLVPEVGVNIAMALPKAESINEVVGLSGRIVKVGRAVQAVGEPVLGGSGHVGRVVLAAVDLDPSKRAAMNIRYGEDVLAAVRKLGLKIGSFDRGQEPEKVSTMEWGTKTAIKEAGHVPDLVYDLGAVGKEPMIRLLGSDAETVVETALRVLDELK